MGLFSDLLGGGVIGAVSSLFGGNSANKANAEQAERTNEFNAEQAQLNREFNATEAQKNRDFQMTMSGSSYQRAIGDLQKAGLNPMLAYSQGGASTPAGAAASGTAASGVKAEMRDAVTPAISSALTLLTAQNLKEQNEKIRAETEKTVAERDKLRQDVDVGVASAGELRQRTANMVEQIPKLRAEIHNLQAEFQKIATDTTRSATEAEVNRRRAELLDADKGLRNLEQQYTRGRISLNTIEQEISRYEAMITGSDVTRARNEEKFEAGGGGNVRRWLGVANSATDSIRNIRRPR